MLSLRCGGGVRRRIAAATCSAIPRARRSRSLNILTAREPMGLPSRRRLFLLASHRMALTGKRKNPNRIAGEIKRFSIFAWLVPTLVPKKIAVSLWNHVSVPCSETDQIWGRRFSSIVVFRSPNFAQRKALVYWDRKNGHFGIWEKKYREMEYGPLGNATSPFCRTERFHVHLKIAIFHLSVWLIGPGGWKSNSGRGPLFVLETWGYTDKLNIK